MEVRPLGPGDRKRLSTFACAGYGEWSQEIEDGIRMGLTKPLERGDVQAAGLFVGDDLAGVTVWTTSSLVRPFERDETRWTNGQLAVARDHQGRGFAKVLKSHVLDNARAAGAGSLVSWVHEDNKRMIAVNNSLGGQFVRDPVTIDYRPSRYLIFQFTF